MTPSVLAVQRRNLSLILQSLAELTQARAAELSGVDATALSRMGAPKGSGDDTRTEWERITAILAACQIKCVPCTVTTIDPEELRALRKLASLRTLDVDATASGFGAL